MNLNIADLEGFMKTIFHIFNKHAPVNRKYIHANKAPFMIKDLHKAIMERSKLKNKFLKSSKFSDSKIYTSQRIFVRNLLKNTKRTFFNNLDIRKVTDNEHFGKLPFHSFLTNSQKARKEIWQSGIKQFQTTMNYA